MSTTAGPGATAAAAAAAGCGAPDQATALPAGVDLAKETVIAGVVTAAESGEPVPGAYVRLLDRDGEFTAEVVTSPAGQFRFFAAPGSWTVRVLSRAGAGAASVTAERGVTEVAVPVAAD
ncbi:MAG TPA: DUF1416 domain-containing protein [Micromonosporaceae bacterium]|nr:DUF1416 domain-containing protein [Micromonosporaceae bacterium]